jgi:hypothetical protein
MFPVRAFGSHRCRLLHRAPRSRSLVSPPSGPSRLPRAALGLALGRRIASGNGLPTPPFTPAAPKNIREPFDHDDFLFELKTDGFRARAHIGPEQTPRLATQQVYKRFPTTFLSVKGMGVRSIRMVVYVPVLVMRAAPPNHSHRKTLQRDARLTAPDYGGEGARPGSAFISSCGWRPFRFRTSFRKCRYQRSGDAEL